MQARLSATTARQVRWPQEWRSRAVIGVDLGGIRMRLAKLSARTVLLAKLSMVRVPPRPYQLLVPIAQLEREVLLDMPTVTIAQRGPSPVLLVRPPVPHALLASMP